MTEIEMIDYNGYDMYLLEEDNDNDAMDNTDTSNAVEVTTDNALAKRFGKEATYRTLVAYGTESGIDWIVTEIGPSDSDGYRQMNGYIEVDENHPWYGADDESMIEADVHGGVTYADGRIFGFDTAHLGDYVPMLGMHQMPGTTHKWTLLEVGVETKKFAAYAAHVARVNYEG